MVLLLPAREHALNFSFFPFRKLKKKTEEPGDWLPNRSCSIYKQAMFHKGVRRFLASGITVSVAAHFGSRCKETPDNNQKGSCVPTLLNLRVNATRTTKCEGEERPSPSRAFMRKLRTNSTGDSFPNFSRHGKSSMLKKYLSDRVYNQVSCPDGYPRAMRQAITLCLFLK